MPVNINGQNEYTQTIAPAGNDVLNANSIQTALQTYANGITRNKNRIDDLENELESEVNDLQNQIDDIKDDLLVSTGNRNIVASDRNRTIVHTGSPSSNHTLTIKADSHTLLPSGFHFKVLVGNNSNYGVSISADPGVTIYDNVSASRAGDMLFVHKISANTWIVFFKGTKRVETNNSVLISCLNGDVGVLDSTSDSQGVISYAGKNTLHANANDIDIIVRGHNVIRIILRPAPDSIEKTYQWIVPCSQIVPYGAVLNSFSFKAKRFSNTTAGSMRIFLYDGDTAIVSSFNQTLTNQGQEYQATLSSINRSGVFNNHYLIFQIIIGNASTTTTAFFELYDARLSYSVTNG